MADLPQRFPCWCKATYSWGGETKKDLGFIEGDLIEALNAGDGQWWMGRLRRDPRAIGLFPSNFVQVLADSFQPAPNVRNASPLSQFVAQKASASSARDRKGTPEAEKAPAPVKKKKTFRPYSSMKVETNPNGSLRKSVLNTVIDQELGPRIPSTPPRQGAAPPLRSHGSRNGVSASTAPRPKSLHGLSQNNSSNESVRAPHGRHGSIRDDSRASSPQSYHQAHPPSSQRGPSPQPQYRAVSPQPNYAAAPTQPRYQTASPAPPRPRSPLPTTYHDGSPFPQIISPSRQTSQRSYQAHDDFYGAPEEMPHAEFEYEQQTSPPPPPPPAHRSTFQASRTPSPQEYAHPSQEYAPPRGYAPPPQEYAPPPQQYAPPPQEYTPPPQEYAPPPQEYAAPPQGYTPPPQEYAYHAPPNHQIHTPMAPSPSANSRMTPSPLRDAMNDVMMSLQDMSTSAQSPPPGANDIWSPEAFDLVRAHSDSRHHARAAPADTDVSFSFDQGDGEDLNSRPFAPSHEHQVGDYVQRMEHRLEGNGYDTMQAPERPLKGTQYSHYRSESTSSRFQTSDSSAAHDLPQLSKKMRHRKSAFELGHARSGSALGRTYTTKTNATNSTESSSATQSSNSTQLTSRSIMSGASASGLSATSAGSLSRHKFGLGSQRRRKGLSLMESKSSYDLRSSARSIHESEASGPSYHESHASHIQPDAPVADWTAETFESGGIFGGLSAPKAKKSGFFKKMIESAKTTAKTGAATARSTLASTSRPGSRAGSPTKSASTGSAMAGFGNSTTSRPATSAGGAPGQTSSGSDWMQVRRDINRSNSISRREVEDRAERCELHGLRPVYAIDQLREVVEGNEGLDGLALSEPTDFTTPNLALVDKNTRFLQNAPPMITAGTLAQNYLCRPYKSDVQRLRAIFTWVAERIVWEEDFEGQLDTRRVVHTKRGCSEEIAMVVADMCAAVGLHCELVRGYLKQPGETLDLDALARGNHYWNAVIIDGEWRVLDCSLASPTHPRRSAYSSAGSQSAEAWYFLAKPLEICFTHIPLLPEQQHIVPPVGHEILIALPCATPNYFRQGLDLVDFNTSMQHLENLEMAHFHLTVPEDVECIAETEVRSFAHDPDGDIFESGDIVKKQVFAQADWIGGRKRYTIKALLPGDEGRGTLKIYAGKRGLMHSIRDNPHAMAVALPLSHTGQNPPYNFVTRHPTPHAQRHDLYIAQPQCARLLMNNTFVFCVRQHPSSLSRFTPDTWGAAAANNGRPVSPNPLVRPGSAMSMVSTSISASQYSDTSSNASGAPGMSAAQQKPAKLAIQTPSQKIIRLTRKQENMARSAGEMLDSASLSTSWETVIKIGEKGVWRGLVLADRSARWCVFAEWVCE